MCVRIIPIWWCKNALQLVELTTLKRLRIWKRCFCVCCRVFVWARVGVFTSIFSSSKPFCTCQLAVATFILDVPDSAEPNRHERLCPIIASLRGRKQNWLRQVCKNRRVQNHSVFAATHIFLYLLHVLRKEDTKFRLLVYLLISYQSIILWPSFSRLWRKRKECVHAFLWPTQWHAWKVFEKKNSVLTSSTC